MPDEVISKCGVLLGVVIGTGVLGYEDGESEVMVVNLAYKDLESGDIKILALATQEDLAEKLIADIGDYIFGEDAVTEATNKILELEAK